MKPVDKRNLLNHLANYKQTSLHICESGTWWKHGKPYSHILPIECSDRNLIDAGYHEELADLVRRYSVKKHQGFHHLNSSQALAVNLFGPLIIEHRMSILDDQLESEPANAEFLFEHIEDRVEATNFDFCIRASGKSVFVEVKYTEGRFGPAKPDAEHIDKYKMVYQSRLKEMAIISEAEFFKSYQLWRNLIYTDMGDVIFVLPRFRSDLAGEVAAAIKRISNKDRARIRYIDDICDSAENDGSGCFRSHYGEFRRKYLPDTKASLGRPSK